MACLKKLLTSIQKKKKSRFSINCHHCISVLHCFTYRKLKPRTEKNAPTKSSTFISPDDCGRNLLASFLSTFSFAKLFLRHRLFHPPLLKKLPPTHLCDTAWVGLISRWKKVWAAREADWFRRRCCFIIACYYYTVSVLRWPALGLVSSWIFGRRSNLLWNVLEISSLFALKSCN